MTAVPLGMLVVFAMWMAGGPKASVRWLETILGSTVTWLSGFVR